MSTTNMTIQLSGNFLNRIFFLRRKKEMTNKKMGKPLNNVYFKAVKSASITVNLPEVAACKGI